MPYETRQGFKNSEMLKTIADNDREGYNVFAVAIDKYFLWP